jgi:hypothetical protein
MMAIAEVNKLTRGGASLQITNVKMRFSPVDRLLSEEVIIEATSVIKHSYIQCGSILPRT